MLREYDKVKVKEKHTSFPPLVEPTGLFSLTAKAVSGMKVP